jgi:hypothetical protein
MKFARLLGLLVVVMILVPFAYADGPVTMVFQNVNGANGGPYYVSPYLGTLNGQTVTLFCDDILNEVNFCCDSGSRTRIERPEPGGAADAAGVAMFGYHDGSAGFTAEDMLL